MTINRATNANRAGRALNLLTSFIAETGADTARDAIADLVADLLHLARGRGLDAQALSDTALRTMVDEVASDADTGMSAIQRRFCRLLPDDGSGYSLIAT